MAPAAQAASEERVAHFRTFSPVRATMSRGPYMNRPTRTCGPSSAAITSLARWLAVTFWKDRKQLSFCKQG